MNFLVDSAEGARAMAALHSVLWVENKRVHALLARHELMQTVRNRVHTVATVIDMIAYLNGFAYFHDREEYPLPGVIVLDLDLPGVDGFAALEWLRASSRFKRIGIIVTSNTDHGGALDAAIRLGADACMFKPFDRSEFRRIAQELKLPVLFREAEQNPAPAILVPSGG